MTMAKAKGKGKPKKRKLTCDLLIRNRRLLWEQEQDINLDQELREAMAQELVSGKQRKALLKEIKSRPELLIPMFMVIVDKQGDTVPFFPNAVQARFQAHISQALEDYAAGRRVNLRFLVLKGRQQGFTSYITAYQLARAIISVNFAGYTVADNSDNTEAIFADKAKFPYDKLPDIIKPSEKYNTRRELHFEALNSKWRVATAGKKDVGRSKTLQMWHGSEAAFWDDLQHMLVGIKPALTPASICILESTANGFNEFKDLWDEANDWERLFYEWWETPEYRYEFESPEAEQRFKAEVLRERDNTEAYEDWLYDRCKWLIEGVGLEWQQTYWYYRQRDLKEAIKQEYPCSADEAFLASGRCIFDTELVMRRKRELEQQGVYWDTGSFRIKWRDAETRDRIEKADWWPHQDGMIRIYEHPDSRTPYVIGADTKGEGKDFFAAAVINNITGQVVATLHRGFRNSTEFAHQVYCLGRYYNNALVGVEMNFNTHPIEELTRLGYTHQYVRKVYDTYTGKHQERYGFRTDGNTRPLIISKFVDLVDNHIDWLVDARLLGECLTFVEDDNNRPDAESGKHDDLLFAHMIAYEIRPQQSQTEQEEKTEQPEKLITELRKRNRRRRR